jgi:hypothetical protein
VFLIADIGLLSIVPPCATAILGRTRLIKRMKDTSKLKEKCNLLILFLKMGELLSSLYLDNP